MSSESQSLSIIFWGLYLVTVEVFENLVETIFPSSLKRIPNKCR